MKRVEPTVAALVVALLASLAVHLPVYGVLGVMTKWLDAKSSPEARAGDAAPVEFELPPLPPLEEEEEPAEEPESLLEDEVEGEERPPAETSPEREWERRVDDEEPEERTEPPEVEVVPVPEEEVVPATPPPPNDRIAVQQRSRDPEVEAPENARFLADENNRVEEETVARIRSLTQDAEQVEAGDPVEATLEPEEGNADEQLARETREMEGSDRRLPTESETEEVRPREASETPPPNVRSRGNEREEGERRAPSSGGTGEAREAAAERGGEPEPEWETITIDDGQGTFVIRRRVQPEGSGGGEGGGERREARAGREGDGRRRTAQRSRGGRGRGSGSEGANLRVSWSQFEEIVGEEELEQARQAYVEERLSRQRGRHRERQRNWRRFRAAIENYVPGVRSGNQTALNAAASPFAAYIAAVHRRIHPQYVNGFIARLPADSSNPMNDQSLRTKLEIIFNRDGSIHRIGVVRTSGLLPFDFSAYSAVMRAQPYPAPPESILSGDGRAYMHWSFYRNSRQCGTFNAEPYILPNPPGGPRQRRDPLSDGPQRGGLVPGDAQPTWGTEGEQEGGAEHDHDHDHEGEGEGQGEGPPPAVRPGEVLGRRRGVRAGAPS